MKVERALNRNVIAILVVGAVLIAAGAFCFVVKAHDKSGNETLLHKVYSN